jgi:uncharacterized membrane protein YeiH
VSEENELILKDEVYAVVCAVSLAGILFHEVTRRGTKVSEEKELILKDEVYAVVCAVSLAGKSLPRSHTKRHEGE